MKTKKRGKMAYVLQAISIIPLFLFALVILALSMHLFTTVMYQEVEENLCGVARTISAALDQAYPGDYYLDGDVSLSLMKGEKDLTREYQLVDQFKESSSYDITLFYQDTSILTTIYDQDGSRLIGRGAAKKVVEEVLDIGQEKFYPNTIVFETKYFCYYVPLKNADGSVVGMLLITEPSAHVNNAIRRASYPLLIVVIAVALVISFGIHLYTKGFDQVLRHISSFLSSVSKGDLTAELDNVVLARNDEFGDIGLCAVKMQQEIRRTVETDALTELFNRRSGERKLRQIMEKSKMNETPFCLAIGDIDFFKKVNDTYGHACGDKILKEVASVLSQHMSSVGFVARWGGEEFLLVFDRMTVASTEISLKNLLEKIRAMEIPYENEVVKVTMTFGLTGGDPASSRDELLKIADDKLYEGKTGGRNRVIV